jgi:hypothetical protein
MTGFGNTEKEAALKIIEECYQAFEARGIQGIYDLQMRYANEVSRYRKMSRDEAPDRYYCFWAMHNKIYEGKSITEFTIHHINKRSELASDGRSLLVTRWILTVDEVNGALIYRLEDSLDNQ